MRASVNIKGTKTFLNIYEILLEMVKDERIDQSVREEYAKKILNINEG